MQPSQSKVGASDLAGGTSNTKDAKDGAGASSAANANQKLPRRLSYIGTTNEKELAEMYKKQRAPEEPGMGTIQETADDEENGH